MNKYNLLDMYTHISSSFHSITEFIIFSSACEISIKIHHILSHIETLNKVLMIEIISSMFFDHSAISIL